MKTIIDIAKTELKTLFYSPIAWIIMAIFALQANMTFIDIFVDFIKYQLAGYPNNNITTELFTSDSWRKAVFPNVQQYLYLYIPLVTMGIMSREISSGSIKLLLSSPITSKQIIFGKFLSMMIYGFALVSILGVTVLFSMFGVKDLDIWYVLSGLLGIYLLLCAYSAIGIFMSSLTSYQVVAAIGTLALLALLNYIGQVGQSINFVRDLTYWLSISGRASEMVAGLISSNDVLYFLVVISMFISFTIIKLESGKIKKRIKIVSQYTIVLVVCLIIGYMSSRPALIVYADATRTNHRTLTPNSQDVINKLEGGLTITTFVNILDQNRYHAMPENINKDLKRFEQYTRFKPEINMKYVYYWDKTDNPHLYKTYPNLTDEQIAQKVCEIYEYDFNDFLTPQQVKKIADLSDEGNRFVRLIERDNGDKTFLRIYNDMYVHPFESEISVALKRLVMKLPKVGFVTGHGERDILKSGDRDYSSSAQSKTFRNSLLNQGFEIESIHLSDSEIGDDISILVIADNKTSFTEIETERLNRYIEKGGNLLIAAEPRRVKEMTPLVSTFGVSFKDGILVEKGHDFAPTLIINDLEKDAPEKISYVFNSILKRKFKITTPGTLALDYSLASSKGYQVTPLLKTKDKNCWNEKESTDFVDDDVVLNTEIGEQEISSTTAIALNRTVGNKDQRIIIMGDADCISNGEVSARRSGFRAANFSFFTGMFQWLSNGKAPIDTRRPKLIDNKVNVGKTAGKFWSILFIWLVPLSLLVSCFIIWVKRRKK